MPIPSFQSTWSDNQINPARIQVLEVIDRHNLEAQPIGRVLVERLEEQTQNPDDKNEIYSANIRLCCELLLPKHAHGGLKSCEFDGHYSKGHNMVSITSRSFQRGMVALDLDGLKGQRIGTYLMNEVVKWAKQWPDASVQTIKLSDGQANIENRARRNRFYEQFGIEFVYADVEHRVGESMPMKAGSLNLVDTWKENIQEINVQDFVEDLLGKQAHLSWELEARNRANLNLREDLKIATTTRKSPWWAPSPRPVLVAIAIGLIVWVFK